MTRRGALLFIGLGLAWGIPYLLIKVAVGELSPVVLVFARTGLAAVLLVPVAVAKGALRPVLSHWRMLVLYSVVEIVVPWLLLTRAEQRLSSSLAGLLIAAVPLASVGVAFASGRREHLGRVGAAGLVLGLAGVAFLVGVDVHGSALSAVAEMGVVVLGYAIGATLLGRSLGQLPGLGVVAASFVVSAMIYAPFAIPGLPHHLPAAKVLWSVAGLVVVCTATAFLLLFALVAEVGSGAGDDHHLRKPGRGHRGGRAGPARDRDRVDARRLRARPGWLRAGLPQSPYARRSGDRSDARPAGRDGRHRCRLRGRRARRDGLSTSRARHNGTVTPPAAATLARATPTSLRLGSREIATPVVLAPMAGHHERRVPAALPRGVGRGIRRRGSRRAGQRDGHLPRPGRADADLHAAHRARAR